MEESVLSQDHGNWVEITLNRPDRLNSFTDEMHLRLRSVLTKATSKRAVLLTGAGRGFCAGQDLGDRDPSKMAEAPDLSHTILTFYAPLIRQIRALPLPVICAVNGVAAGAGANIALACDMVLAAQSAKFIQSFAKVGLVPDAGGTFALPRLLGPARAMGLALTAHPLPAQQAEEWGLIWKALPDAELMTEARTLTAQLAEGPTLGLARTKAAIQAGTEAGMEAQLQLEAQYQRECGQSADYAEGVTAFLQKRPPHYEGK